ncbi:MAG: hypothetical protein Q4E13_10480, partial [Clostridia bacterium]|nr:hypothetical protein [Clostridia bacterium]
KDKDYTVSYANNLNVGTATVTITGIGNYTGNITKEFEIAAKDTASEGLTVDDIEIQTYTGEEIKPELTVRDGDKVLVEGEDYVVTYEDNRNAGTATVTITGIGNYSGTLTVTFAIKEKKQSASLAYAQQAAMLAAGTAVEGLVTNRSNAARSYVPTNEEVRSEETGEIIRRTLVFTVAPAQDAEGKIIYRDGVPVYKQRNLHLAKGLVDALVELGYTNIRFVLKDATLEWALAEMNGENNVIRFAPMEEAELTQSEREALGEREALSDCYRVRITAEVNSETVDVTGEIASLMVCFDGAAVRELAEDEAAQCLQVPGNEKLEPTVSDAEYVEEEVRPGYRAALSQSGLLVLILQ